MPALDSWLRCFPAFQLRWIYDESPFALAIKSRQIGFSHATAAGAVRRGFIKRRPQLILSASEDLSSEVLAKARAHCEVLARLGIRGATAFSVDNTEEIAWKSGGRIVALPANKRTARSYSGDTWLDEFAYHTDPEGIRDGVFPMATRGNWILRILSTPNGAQGLFYDWTANPPPGWSVHKVTVDDAIADGYEVDLDKLWSLCGGDERLFAQWYRCRFLDADLQYLPTEMVDRALRWEGKQPRLEDCEIHAGLDVGRTQDLTALEIVAVKDRVAWVLPSITCKRTAFAAQKAMLVDARRTFGWTTLHVDRGGIGRQLAEELCDWWGEDEVKLVDFTNQSKADMASLALRWFRDDRVKLPRGKEGEALRAEAIALRRKVTASGNIQFEVPRTSSGHGDRLWALFLALTGAGEPPVVRGFGQEPLLAVP